MIDLMLHPRVSVIVPVYNVEGYLRRCIDSILCQTFENFELILVDDGSTDNSGLICDEYLLLDNRVRVFHKCNQGPSSTRNYGLDKAIGEWIAFIDSDDYVDPNYLLVFFKYNSASDTLTQVIQGFNIFDIVNAAITLKEGITYNYTDIHVGHYSVNIEKQILLHRWEIWSRLFSLEILNKNNIRFDERVHMFEDGIFWHTYLMYIQRIIYVEEKNYNYYHSASHSSLTVRHACSFEEMIYITQYYKILSDSLIDRFCLSKSKYVYKIKALYLHKYKYLIFNIDTNKEDLIQKLKDIKPSNLKYYKIERVTDIFFVLCTYLPLEFVLKFVPRSFKFLKKLV